MAKKKQTKTIKTEDVTRQPIVVVVGHIDHGKSTLLDYIRKTNIVEGETGGITQHLSAYEVTHKDEKGSDRKITFIDTPGHEAFKKMRLRGAEVADIAILIVSAEEGVKEQTIEALASIKEAKIPYIVAINKIDRPNANIERTKQNLLENEIYLEGLGGEVPWVPISAKEGTGVPDLFDILLLVADLEELKGDSQKDAEGIVIEAHLDPRKGISATLIIKEGTLKSGMYVSSGKSLAPVRIFEDFLNKSIKEAGMGSPVQVIGWDKLPETGAKFFSYATKKEAEKVVSENAENTQKKDTNANKPDEKKIVIPIILKTDVAGSLDAIEHELEKLESEEVTIKLVQSGVGAVSENDIKTATGLDGVFVVGFHTNIDKGAEDLADRNNVQLHMFDIIYKLSEWLGEVIKEQTPEDETQNIIGSAKILKCFNRTKDKQVVGGRVETGSIRSKNPFRIMRQDTEVGHGAIRNIQQQKADTDEASVGTEFGAQIESQIEVIAGDIIEVYKK